MRKESDVRCTVCGYCQCCGRAGRDIWDEKFKEWFPKRVAELEEHYHFFPEHSPKFLIKERSHED